MALGRAVCIRCRWGSSRAGHRIMRRHRSAVAMAPTDAGPGVAVGAARVVRARIADMA